MDNAINYRILYGFPQHIVDIVREKFYNRDIKRVGEKGDYIRDVNLYVFKDETFLREILPKELQEDFEYAKILESDGVGEKPNGNRYPCHTDSDRMSALNIPIFVEKNESNDSFDTKQHHQQFFISKHPELKYHNSEFRKTFTDHGKYLSQNYAPGAGMLNYDFYDMAKPIIMNPRMPHGFFNNGNKKRAMLAIGFLKTDFKTLQSKIPQEWYT
jgi:hypothetical protein